MGIKRGTWKPAAFNKTATTNSGRYGARPATTQEPGVSNSEYHMKTRHLNNEISGQTLNKVSEERQDDLIRATYSAQQDSDAPQPLLVYSNSYKKFKKSAATTTLGASTSASSFGVGGQDTIRQAPEVYSPLFQIANLQLPRDRITMNAWNRNFYDTHPLVHNCINLHATYPINKINIKCRVQEVEDFFKNMIEEMDLMGILQNIALEFWKMGEVFPYAELDPTTGKWKNITILNPDYVHIKKSVIGDESVLSLRPDAALQRLVTSNNPADIQLRKQLDPEIVHHVKKGQNIPLDNFHASHLKMQSSPYDIHGTSIIVSIYKDLMLYDKLRESKFAQADNLVNPITLVKVGGSSEGEYHPTEGDLEKWRQTLEAAQYDKDFKIISHAGVDIQRVGASGQIIDISGDMNFILDNILYGLMVPKAVLTQEGASYNSATVGLEVLKTRYEAFRNMMARWLVNRVFAPISEIQEFYDYSKGKKTLIVPEIEWNQMILFDMDNYINVLNTLSQQQPDGSRAVSRSTVFKSLGLDPEEECKKVRYEMVQDAITIKEKMALGSMSLSELRAIKEGEDITEKTQEPLPGTPGAAETMPGAMPGGLGLGGPPLGGPPLGGPPLGGGLGPELGPPPPGAGPGGGGPIPGPGGGGGAPPPGAGGAGPI